MEHYLCIPLFCGGPNSSYGADNLFDKFLINLGFIVLIEGCIETLNTTSAYHYFVVALIFPMVWIIYLTNF
jgi:hypothetical protein